MSVFGRKMDIWCYAQKRKEVVQFRMKLVPFPLDAPCVR